MAKLSVLFTGIALILAAGCQPKVEMEMEAPVDVAAEKAAIRALLDGYVESVVNEDMEQYASKVAHDTAMVNFGGFGEPIVGWQALEGVMRGQNEALSDTKISVHDLAIHVGGDGTMGWATSLWDLKAVMGENPLDLGVRCTWVLEKRQGSWLIVHFHKSMAH